MKKKSVRDMSVFARFRHSIEGRMIRSIFLLCLILGAAAITFGIWLYSMSVGRDYRTRTWQISKTASKVLDKEVIREKSELVLGIYDSMNEFQRLQNGEEQYQEMYYQVYDESYETLRKTLRAIQIENEAIAGYVAALDLDKNRMIFIADGDNKDTYCPPGKWDSMEKENLDEFINGAKVNVIDRMYGATAIPSIVTNMKQYGYRCTAGTYLMDLYDYPVFVFYDTDMRDVAEASRVFFLQYIVILAGVGFLVGSIMLISIRRKVVRPINKLAYAAADYIKEKQNGKQISKHFSKLDIHTGDEIENLYLTIRDMENDMGEYFSDLANATAEKERINTELNVAQQIQNGMLPHVFPPFPDRTEFDIYASMDPAKEVGGDFYDYYLLDNDHLAIVAADVSGKGIPAALFMMGAKIMINNIARSMPKSPARILEEVNNQICENNSIEMFVTVWLGILEIPTGILRCANAGHEYPMLRRAGGQFELIKDRHGLVIGGMEGMKYHDYEIVLEPGDMVFQYTDGVTEATNENNELFGNERLLQALNRTPERDTEKVLEIVRQDIDEFVGSAPQFDDVTMICLCYRKERKDTLQVNTKTINVEAVKDNLPYVISFVEEQLEKAACPLKTLMQISMAAEEIFVNIASYAYQDGIGNAEIKMAVSDDPVYADVTFADSGIPYDPLAKPDPDVKLDAESRQIGGLGVYLVKQTMDEVEYRYNDGKNIFRLRKYF